VFRNLSGKERKQEEVLDNGGSDKGDKLQIGGRQEMKKKKKN